jgi:hypothetical protein
MPRQSREHQRGFDRAAYNRAAWRQSLDQRLSTRPVPARITLALDLRGLDGDQVDRDLDVWEPPEGWTNPGWEPGTAVDRWEDGTLIPTREQITVLAALTGLPWRFFYTPVDTMPSRVFVCERRRGGRGLTIVRSEVDHNGVLHIFHEPDEPDDEPDEPKPKRRLPAEPRRAQRTIWRATPVPVDTHRFDRDYGDPMSCRICGLSERNRRHDDGSGPVSDDSGMPDERR